MNNKRQSELDHLKSLRILDEMSANQSITQRDLSKRLGIALGLVNSYVRNLIRKGYVTVKAIPPKRYAYYITPKGFAEKSRLTYDLLSDYTRVYREARSNLSKAFVEMKRRGAQKIVFAGADEIAEIAYITLQELGMGVVGVIDDERAGSEFLGFKVLPLESVRDLDYDHIVITSYVRREKLLEHLVNAGANRKLIRKIFVD